MGLMKLSTYYKDRGDSVTFFKGDLTELVLNETLDRLFEQLHEYDEEVQWNKYWDKVRTYIRNGKTSVLAEIPETERALVMRLFKYYRRFFHEQYYFLPEFRRYDRVCVTTLFTFYWKITVETINFVKQLCKDESGFKTEGDPGGVLIGGVLASILPERIEKATGIRPFQGVLDRKGLLDKDSDVIIDTLPLDYSILDEIDYQYPESDAYFGYATRGCVNHCKFCAVPKLEPTYIEKLPVSEQIDQTRARFGEKRDLLLLDNNVLASPRFDEIIDDIKSAGFAKGETFVEPNQFEISIINLRNGVNDRGCVNACVRLYHRLLDKLKKNTESYNIVYHTLSSYDLLDFHTATRDAILGTYETISPFFANFFSRKNKSRRVDFNQGLDARLITDERMAKLAEIELNPVRIAFDRWSLNKIYERAVRIASQHGFHKLSNYLLYNFEDRPVDLYRRLRLNIELCEELNVDIYSFPMKYHPIEDPEFFDNRNYVGKWWNRKFIRTIQAILNSTKGKVGRGKDFFYRAFGRNEKEFSELLYMPEEMIIHRIQNENNGRTDAWRETFNSLSELQRDSVLPVIENKSFATNFNDPVIEKLLEFYRKAD